MKKRILCLAIALCMIAAMLPVVALAESTPAGTLKLFKVVVDDGQQTGEGTSWNTNLTYARYGKTAENGRGIAWDTGVGESNYNIKVAQTANGLEVTLRDAKLIRTANHIYGMLIRYEGKVTIRLIGDNVISYDDALVPKKHNVPAALYVKATEGATITGTGSLTAKGDGFANGSTPSDVNGDGTNDYTYNFGSVIEADCDLTIENVSLDIAQVARDTTDPWAGHGIRCKGNLTIDGANVKIYAQYGSGIKIATGRRDADIDTTGKNVVITNGAKVDIESKSSAIMWGNGNLIINNEKGDTQVTLKSDSYAMYKKTPVLEGNFNATASTVKNGDGASEYTADPKGGEAITSGQYRYFHLEAAAPAEPELSAPIVAPALNNSLDMNVGIPKTDVGADGYAMFVPADGGDPIKVDLTDVEGGYFVATLPDLAAKQMTDAYTVTIYGADDKAASAERTVSVVDYAIGQLRDEKNANDVAFKTLLVDMLVYGAMAQTQFGYNTDKLAIADLTPEELALATGNMQVCENGLQAAAGYKGTTFILESSIEMATAFDKAVVGEGAYAIVTFENHKGEQVTSEKIYETAKYSNTYNAVFISDDLAAADGRCKVTWTIYNAEGAAVLSVVDSLESYTKRAMDAGDDFVEKLMIYSDSAKAFFLANV